MNKITRLVLASMLIALAATPSVFAADKCPSEVAEAKALLSKATAAAKKSAARGQEVQAPRQLAGAKQDGQAPRSQDVQAPRSQDVQAPRAQEVQAPRSQDVQAPRSQEVQAPRSRDVQTPRSQDVQAPRLDDARKLVREAEAACKKGDMALSASKGKQAIQLLK